MVTVPILYRQAETSAQDGSGITRAGGLGHSPFLRHTPWLGITALSLLLGGIPPWLQVAQPHLQDLVKDICTLKTCGCRLVHLTFRHIL